MIKDNELDFSKLNTAFLTDLKQQKIVKSVSVSEQTDGRYLARVEDFFGNSITIKVGAKSADHISAAAGFSEALEGSARIVMIDEVKDKLRLITSEYTLTRHMFNTPIVLSEQRKINKIKASLIRKGLRVDG